MRARSHFFTSLLLSSLIFTTIYGGERRGKRRRSHSRSDTITAESLTEAEDHFLEGYIQALLDMHFHEARIHVRSKEHVIFLSNFPNNPQLKKSIVGFVSDIPGVCDVKIDESRCEEAKARDLYADLPRIKGEWFPQSTVLFSPLIADPREPTYSTVKRYSDDIIGRDTSAVSYGDDFPIFRWRNVLRWNGDMQFGVTAAVYAVFNHTRYAPGEHCELVNADYQVGGKLDYAVDRWAFRGRIFHISSHLGDEFLVNQPDLITERTNPSFEIIDGYVSYQMYESLRVYGGLGWIFHSHKSFPMKNFYIQYGAEARLFGHKWSKHQLYGTPFLALNIANWEVRDWRPDMTLKMGYEWSKLQGIGRKVRIYAGYHHGYSDEGQFFTKKASYWDVGVSWGF